MKTNFVITMCLVVVGIVVNGANGKQNFDRTDFYAAMSSNNLDSVNNQLAVIEKSSFGNKEAFEGTLLMKKAGIVPNPANKLSLFKSGHKKLEEAITKENTNAELRFLRLMIQEHAPKILGYKKQIAEDNKMIHSGYKSLPPVVQKAIADYSKKSKVLKPALS